MYIWAGLFINVCISIALSTNESISLESEHIWHICQYNWLFTCFVSVHQFINTSLYNPPIRSIARSRGLVNELRESPWSVGLRSCASKGFFISTAWVFCESKITMDPNSFGKMAPVENRLETKLRFPFFAKGSFLEGEETTVHLNLMMQPGT